MTPAVHAAITALIAREGGYTDHPSDRGGPTKFGITEQVARAFGYAGDMRDLPMGFARDIYEKRYWYQPRYADVSAMSQAVAEELFDTGVNMGTSTASKFLQRALNALNRQGKAYPDIGVDGAIGALTLHSLKTYLAQRGDRAVPVLLRLLNAQQASRYLDIADADKTQEDFVFGWIDHRVS